MADQHRVRILRLPAVIDRVGFSKSTIYREMDAGRFPKPIPIGVRCVGWVEHEIDEYLSALIPADRHAA